MNLLKKWVADNLINENLSDGIVKRVLQSPDFSDISDILDELYSEHKDVIMQFA